MKNWLRPDFWKLKMKKWIHKLNEINYFNVLDDVFFDAWSNGEIRIAVSPILVEADFTAWWRNWGDHFWIFVTALGHTCAYITGVNELNQSKLIFWIPILTCVQFIFSSSDSHTYTCTFHFFYSAWQRHTCVHTSFFALRLGWTDTYTCTLHFLPFGQTDIHVYIVFFTVWPDTLTRVYISFFSSARQTYTCTLHFFPFGYTCSFSFCTATFL